MQQYADIYLLQIHSTCSTSDDGCCDTRNTQSDFAVNKYPHTVASSLIFINTEKWICKTWYIKFWNGDRLYICWYNSNK